jgi:ABC-type glycerol-3-phosphate transport system substrate-binding protein
MADGKFKVSNYIEAVKYVSHKLMGCTNIDAYSRTFPDKMARFAAQGVSSKDIASYVTAYNKSKLVNLIMEQTLVPMWVLNQDLYQRALNVQAELMVSANSEKVRSDAANSLLTHLKQPETQKVELNVGMKEDNSISALREATLALVAQQKQALLAGAMTAQDVAHTKVIEGERLQ